MKQRMRSCMNGGSTNCLRKDNRIESAATSLKTRSVARIYSKWGLFASDSRAASLVLTFGITVTYFCQAAGANRLAAILAKRAWRSLRVKVHLKGDAVCS